MITYVLRSHEVDRSSVAIVGGKAANLGELSGIEGIHVPDGFCVTTDAYRNAIESSPELDVLLEELERLTIDDREKIGNVGARIRTLIERITIPEDMATEITDHITELGVHEAYAVRSSATAEDLPTASFAGQQDTYLNIIGKETVVRHIRMCWASLFTERAIVYRIQNGFGHRKVYLAVVVQKMIFPQVAGILFTADPVTSNRKVVSIDASFGLGEALVSGLVNADVYKVRDGSIIHKTISTKKLAIHAVNDGGTEQRKIETDRQRAQALTDEQILRLEHMGRTIEKHFGTPQDIEWCLADDTFHIVQSRPITTLYPIPVADDQENHVYVSVGHQQMMTDPIRPLGLSFYLLTTRAPMRTAGGRLFVDVARQLASPDGRALLIDTLGKSDPLIRDALTTLVEREGFIPSVADDNPRSGQGPSHADFKALIEYDPAIVPALIEHSQASIRELQHDISMKSGVELFDFILEDIQQLKKTLSDPQGFAVIMTAMNASWWINERMEEWLGEKNVADILSQSVPNNITSTMGLALLDVADTIRPYPEVIEYLRHVLDDTFLDELEWYNGGRETRDAIRAYLNEYGMRGAGEIDITRTRWSETPATLIPLILNNIRNLEPGASSRKFEQGRQEALHKEQELLHRLRQLPDGTQKAEETARMIHLIRNFAGYREYPKYAMVSRYFLYKQALLKEAMQLVQAGVVHRQDDIYYLTFEELREVVRTQVVDSRMIVDRMREYASYAKLTPPRVITSDGEIIRSTYNRSSLPTGAMAGLAVSSGVIEGRARVILNIADADIEDGDILVTVFTDPSWTPLFVSIKGLVTEVGGLMTHGAVIAREYGLPAVVGVENATRQIRDGQQIRVNGTDGYVEIL